MASHCVMVFLAPSVVMIVADVTFRNQNDVPYFIFSQKAELIAWQCFRILYFQNRSAASTSPDPFANAQDMQGTAMLWECSLCQAATFLAACCVMYFVTVPKQA